MEPELANLVKDGWLFHVTPADNVRSIATTRTIVCPEDAPGRGAQLGIGSSGSRRDVVQLVDLGDLHERDRAARCADMARQGGNAIYHLLAISPELRSLDTFRTHWHVRQYCTSKNLRYYPHIEVWIESRQVPAKEIRDLGVLPG